MNSILNFISCGVYVVSSKNAGCIINTLTQINSKDPLVSISINKDNFTNKIIKETKRFAVSLLNVDVTIDMLGTFGFKSSENYDKFRDFSYIVFDDTYILTQNVIGYIICELKEVIDCDTHDLFIGKVVNEQFVFDGIPMTYEYYKKIKKGTTPLKAPSFIESTEEIVETDFKKFQCIICGYIYDEAVEDIKFADLPGDWVCPKCRVGKDKFKRIK